MWLTCSILHIYYVYKDNVIIYCLEPKMQRIEFGGLNWVNLHLNDKQNAKSNSSGLILLHRLQSQSLQCV
jgi:hypothetical protein